MALSPSGEGPRGHQRGVKGSCPVGPSGPLELAALAADWQSGVACGWSSTDALVLCNLWRVPGCAKVIVSSSAGEEETGEAAAAEIPAHAVSTSSSSSSSSITRCGARGGLTPMNAASAELLLYLWADCMGSAK